MWSFSVFFCCLYCLISTFTASGNVVLIGNNVTMSFEDIGSNFAPLVTESGIHGILYVAEPLNACSPLTNKIDQKMDDAKSPFVLMIRGGCSFDVKVRRAQTAGFKAAIVFDNEYADLIAMAGNSTGIRISAVFVSKTAGETLARYTGIGDMEVWIYPSADNSAWSIMAISFISLLAMSAALATCFFVRRHRIRRERSRAPQVREFHGMSSRLVKGMPSLIFTAVLEENCTSSTCAICLDDYNMGDKLRVLPCRHKFHATCVDAWLTSWRTFCPICKRDARTSTGEPPASESTPLLQSNPSSVASSSILSSFRSSGVSASMMHIGSSSRSPHLLIHSISPYPHLRNMSSQVSQNPYSVSPHSINYPSLLPPNSRCISPYIQSPSNVSSSFLGSSTRPANPLHYSGSAASLSPFSSAHSLPGS